MPSSRTAPRVALFTIVSLLVILGLAGGVDAATWDFNNDGNADIIWRNLTTNGIAIWLMNGTTIATMGAVQVIDPSWSIVGVADFTGDDKADILWVQQGTQFVSIWPMNGTAIAGTVFVGIAAAGQTVAGVGDVDNDGNPDIVWRDAAGTVTIWFMNGTTRTSTATLPVNPGADWTLVQVADFDGDGRADLLWRNRTTGQVAIWLLNGATISSLGVIGTIPFDWSIVGVGNFNVGGKADILWRQNGGQLAIWFMDGTTVASVTILSAPSADWAVVGVRDFNGDGLDDILWRRTDGTLGIWTMGTPPTSGLVSAPAIAWNTQRVEPFHWPAITSANNTTFTEEVAGQFFVTTMGFPAPAITRTGDALPGTVTFVDNGNGTATLGGTPDPGTADTYVFQFTANNGTNPNAVQDPFTLTVNNAPAITSANSVSVAPGVAMTPFTVQTNGDPTNTITRTDNPGVLPSGVTFLDNGNNTATISGTPAAGTQTLSPYLWLITAANGVLPNATQNFTFNVVCPTITVNGTIPDLTLNQAMATAGFTQGGGNPPITWSASGLPTGVGINTSSGDVTGTPTQSGPFSATITATDVGGCTGSKVVAFNVNVAPQITSADNVTVAPGVAMTPFTVQTTGTPTNTITRTNNPGVLPTGVLFNDNGDNTATISGTPAAGTQSGSPYAWLITAANGVLPNATQNFAFNVVCPAINVLGGPIPALVFNQAMTMVQFSQTGGNGTIAWSAVGLPPGTGIGPANGQVTGTPTATGTFNYTVTATDAGGCTGSTNQQTTVAPVAGGDSYSGLVDNTQFAITGGTTGSPSTPFVGQLTKLTANDQPSGGVTANAGTVATTAGGSVTIAADGTFIYTPPANPGAARITADSFQYTVSSNTGGGTAVNSAPATVNLTLVGRVWYVLNTAGGGGNGQSQSPFNTLSAAIAASTAGTTTTNTDTIYVYAGDGTTTNLTSASVLKLFQRFIGQGVALVVNGNTLVAAGSFPLIGNTLTFANDVVVNGIDMSTTTNSALVGANTTNLNVTVRNLTTSTGTALNLSGATHPTGSVTVSTVTTSGGGSGAVHVSLTNSDATVALNGGSLAGAGANVRAIDINGGTGGFTYAGTISNTGAANDGGGIRVANKTGTSTVTLSGATKTLSTGPNTAVDISGNSAGTTVDLSSGGFGITTAAGTGFNATGSGTVNVGGTNNISAGAGATNGKGLVWNGVTSGATVTFNNVTSASGNAVEITSSSATDFTFNDVTSSTGSAVTITTATGDFTFHAVNSNGATKGISVNSATGSFTVNGTGTTAGTGGSILNSTNRGAEFISSNSVTLKNMTFTNNGTGASGTNNPACSDAANGTNTNCQAGIHLQSVTGATLTNLDVTDGNQIGINGHTVSNLVMSNLRVQRNGDEPSEENMQFFNLTGTSSLTGTNIIRDANRGIEIQNSSGTLNFTMTGTTIDNTNYPTTGGNQGISFHAPLGSSANMTIVATGNTFAKHFSYGFHATFAGTAVGNVTLGAAGAGNNNTFTNSALAANITGTTTGTVTFSVVNNQQTADETVTSNQQTTPFSFTRGGGSGNWTGTVSNNKVGNSGTAPGDTFSGCYVAGCTGLEFTNNGTGGSYHMTITGNEVNHVNGHGIAVFHTSGAVGDGTTSAVLTGNTVQNPDVAPGAPGPSSSGNAMHFVSGDGIDDQGDMCLEIGGAGGLANTLNGSWAVDGAGTTNNQSIRLRPRTTNAGSFRIRNYTPDGTPTDAEVIAFVETQNTFSGAGVEVGINRLPAFTNAITGGAAACP